MRPKQFREEVLALTERVVPGSDIYSRAFEHFLINKIRAFHAYTGRDTPMTYWRTSSGMEVELILGDMKVALEFKSGSQFSSRWLKGLRALKQEYAPRRTLSQIQKPCRTDDGIELLPWREFCQALWSGEFHE